MLIFQTIIDYSIKRFSFKRLFTTVNTTAFIYIGSGDLLKTLQVSSEEFDTDQCQEITRIYDQKLGHIERISVKESNWSKVNLMQIWLQIFFQHYDNKPCRDC